MNYFTQPELHRTSEPQRCDQCGAIVNRRTTVGSMSLCDECYLDYLFDNGKLVGDCNDKPKCSGDESP